MNPSKILAYAVGPIGIGLISLISLPLITWFYSIEDIGRISMLKVTASFILLLMCLGLDQAYVREYHEHNNRPQLLKNTLTPGLILILFFLILIFLFDSNLISYLLYDINSTYLSLMSIVCFVATFISRFLSLILRMEERALAYSMSQLLPKVLFLIFILITFVLGSERNINNLVAAHTLSILTILLVLIWATKSHWKRSVKAPMEWQLLKPLLLFGFPLVIGGIASWGLRVMDRVFLRAFSTLAELGLFSTTMTIAGGVLIFTGIFNTIWTPMIYKWLKEGVDLNKLHSISEHLLAAIYFIIVISGLTSWVLTFFLPAEYNDIKYLITICLLGPLFYTLSEATSVGIAISRKTSFTMIASSIAVVMNALLNFLLIPELGAIGAAIATSISFWLFYILRTEFSKIVWKKFPSVKSYFITLFLMIISIADATIIKDSPISNIIWFVSLILGLILFPKSCTLAINLLLRSLGKLKP